MKKLLNKVGDWLSDEDTPLWQVLSFYTGLFLASCLVIQTVIWIF